MSRQRPGRCPVPIERRKPAPEHGIGGQVGSQYQTSREGPQTSGRTRRGAESSWSSHPTIIERSPHRSRYQPESRHTSYSSEQPGRRTPPPVQSGSRRDSRRTWGQRHERQFSTAYGRKESRASSNPQARRHSCCSTEDTAIDSQDWSNDHLAGESAGTEQSDEDASDRASTEVRSAAYWAVEEEWLRFAREQEPFLEFCRKLCESEKYEEYHKGLRRACFIVREAGYDHSQPAIDFRGGFSMSHYVQRSAKLSSDYRGGDLQSVEDWA